MKPGDLAVVKEAFFASHSYTMWVTADVGDLKKSGKLTPNQVCLVISENSHWTLVLVQDRLGWVSTSYLEVTER